MEDLNKTKVLVNLLKYLVVNFKATYQIDGNPDTLRIEKLSLDFVYAENDTKFILSSEGNEVFSGFLKDYYIDQCRGGGSPFLFRNCESETKGIEIRFTDATRFFSEYENKESGEKLRTLAHGYYDIWCHEPGCRVRCWNLYER